MKMVALGAAALLAAAGLAQAETVYGITGAGAGGSLVSFDSATPGSVTSVGALSGVLSGHAVRAIDFRPADGQLYAFSTAGNAGQLYTVNLGTAALTPVGTGFTLSGTNTFPTRVSMDFNPVADRLRIVTGNSTGANNLRVNPNTGALVAEDTTLAYAAGDPAAGLAPFIAGAAYTNNFAGATSTTLYGFDFNFDSLVTIGSIGGAPNSPNTGIMNTIFAPTTFLTSDGGIGFDISGATGTAFLSYNDSTTFAETFSSMDLTTGAVSPVGAFGSGIDMLDISVVIPSPASIALLGLGGLLAARRRRA